MLPRSQMNILKNGAKLYFIMIQGIALPVGSKSEQDQSQNHIERTHKLLPENIFSIVRLELGNILY